jgi:aminoglycoside 3-N-acetyltransferase
MDVRPALEWLTEVFAVKDRVLEISDTRMAIPEWDSLGVVVLQSRLEKDHGIILTDDEVSKIETVREICQILEKDVSAKVDHPSLIRSLWRNLPAEQKSKIRSLKRQLAEIFLSYGPRDLIRSLRSLGVREGDTIFVHSSFKPSNGFIGSPEQVIDVLLEAVGCAGNLMMVSLPYGGSTLEYLRSLKCFDVRKTASHMGLLTEVFRERKKVLRSLSPTHPVLVCGPDAEWISAGHENCPYPCGSGTPFEKLAQMKGKVVFFDAPFVTLTFFHYLEDTIRDRLPFPLYYPRAFEVPVIDYEGRQITVTVYAFSPDIIGRRRGLQFESVLRKAGLIKSTRIGNTRLHYIEIAPLIHFFNTMVESGNLFCYDFR